MIKTSVCLIGLGLTLLQPAPTLAAGLIALGTSFAACFLLYHLAKRLRALLLADRRPALASGSVSRARSLSLFFPGFAMKPYPGVPHAQQEKQHQHPVA
jgi:hypothetical protein